MFCDMCNLFWLLKLTELRDVLEAASENSKDFPARLYTQAFKELSPEQSNVTCGISL